MKALELIALRNNIDAAKFQVVLAKEALFETEETFNKAYDTHVRENQEN